MGWEVKFHYKAEKEFDALTDNFIQKFKILFDKVRQGGFSNLPKESVKNIGDGIRELRVMGIDGIARSLYVTETGEIVRVLLVFVKKTTKTPPDIIKTAKKRRREINENMDTF